MADYERLEVVTKVEVYQREEWMSEILKERGLVGVTGFNKDRMVRVMCDYENGFAHWEGSFPMRNYETWKKRILTGRDGDGPENRDFPMLQFNAYFHYKLDERDFLTAVLPK